ncbi:uncharacterized protein EI90DRAFT_3041377 [Cantharellus anzutake]|uniref:uncharacterized protein n=1 Tax=Cantharellus anzutake TaxID=1750568 RepID=UPI0019078891|nr:uncharacterized protein EI90DRAFT_3041377 [Cantharellus anzutake]KAF8338038.1 hypothetical protein EI90DRAFT_3041377 [Cantharellus anzutake]
MPLPRFDSVHHALHDTSTSSETSPPNEDPLADAFFETESGWNVLDDIEPIEDNKSTRFATGTRPFFLKRTPTTFSTFSNFSTVSDFSTFSNVIEKHLWLQMARIAGLGILSLVRKLGTSPAYDTEALAGRARQENTQEFKRPPFLADFGEYLRVISEELLEYKIWPENCWMFCSLLQEHLGGSGDGYYTFGALLLPTLHHLSEGEYRSEQQPNESGGCLVTYHQIMTALQSPAGSLSHSWKPLRSVKPRGGLLIQSPYFLPKYIHHDIRNILMGIDGSSLTTHLEKSEENVLQLPNPLILNSDIPDLASQIRSKISSDVQYAALFGLLHVLFSRLETFIAESVIKWWKSENPLIALERVIVWCHDTPPVYRSFSSDARCLSSMTDSTIWMQ